MLIANVNNVAATAGTPIVLTQAENTNGNLELANNVVSVLSPGWYKISGSIVATIGAEGDFGLEILANGTALATASQPEFSAAAASDIVTLPVLGYVEAVAAVSGNVEIQLQPITGSQNATLNGIVAIEKID